MADVFISYHEASAGELAEQISDALEEAGISCWCARRDMTFGGNFAREIPSQIHACKVFLVLLNQDVYQSPYVENEIGMAFKRLKENILILPVELGEFVRKGLFEYYLVHAQSVKFPAQPDEQQIQRLVKRIARNLKQEPNIIKRGECGDYVTYALDENGVLTISGRGPMWDFTLDKAVTYDAPWKDDIDMISHVTIQNGVTHIGNFAFPCFTGIKSVTISNSVTCIGQSAFFGCIGLKSLAIPDSVEYIGNSAFAFCTDAVNIHISDSLEKIDYFTFLGCKGLKSIIIPDCVTHIGMGAFLKCTGLTRAVIPNSVTWIGERAFYDCTELKSVRVPIKANIHPDAFSSATRVKLKM